ncbi:MAG: hypothetical protein NC302_01125 [Bacteroidales bacterium]|nr:hypothetical protein [Bacteroidales bacterium]MCM1414484.1 hypothetical protein [bacterium]MCM1423746.1 hypothetical protein [bacterium]
MTEKNKKTAAYASLAVFVLLLIPILYLTGVNRASGDDYGYGFHTRMAWMGTHSLWEVIRGMCRTVKEYYGTWQGTWFSIALFTLQPEVFHDGAYVIVAVLMLFLWIASTAYLFREVLCRKLHFDGWSCLLITVWFLIISIEFIPGTKSAIYWFNGCAHYMVPFTMCQMLAAWLIRFADSYRKSTFVGIFLFMTLLGGSNYQAALFGLVAAFYACASVWLLRKDKRIFLLGIPMFTELIGLVVSMRAPGNWRRGGEEFGFSVTRAVQTIGGSFVHAVTDIGVYWQERPLALAGLLFLFLLFVLLLWQREERLHIPYQPITGFLLFCLYSAMQAPELYAGVTVSKGVPNTNYLVFLLTAAFLLLMAADSLVARLKGWEKENAARRVYAGVIAAGLLVCAVLGLVRRSNVKDCTSYQALVYITSGQAADFAEQMDLQTMLLEDDRTADVVIPGVNDIQGPLMHMPVTEDKDAWTNYVTSRFYGKQSVVSIDRPVWMERYAAQYGIETD